MAGKMLERGQHAAAVVAADEGEGLAGHRRRVGREAAVKPGDDRVARVGAEIDHRRQVEVDAETRQGGGNPARFAGRYSPDRRAAPGCGPGPSAESRRAPSAGRRALPPDRRRPAGASPRPPAGRRPRPSPERARRCCVSPLPWRTSRSKRMTPPRWRSRMSRTMALFLATRSPRKPTISIWPISASSETAGLATRRAGAAGAQPARRSRAGSSSANRAGRMDAGGVSRMSVGPPSG